MTGPFKALKPIVVIYLGSEVSPLRVNVREKNFKSSPIGIIPRTQVNKDRESKLRFSAEQGGGAGIVGDDGSYVIPKYPVLLADVSLAGCPKTVERVAFADSEESISPLPSASYTLSHADASFSEDREAEFDVSSAGTVDNGIRVV